jgi:hypothetical protein
MQARPVFAEVLEQELRSFAPEPDGQVSGCQPPFQTVAPPFLFVGPQPHVVAAARGSMASEAGGSGPARAPVPPSAPSRTLQPTRVARPLTMREQRAFDDLIRLGADLRGSFTGHELRSAFRALARRYHPDRHPASSEVERARLSRMFAELNENYQRLQATLETRSARS